jgi:nicotinamide mononucleotide transporter
MWVVGIATSLAAMWVFFQKGLYASFGLNTYYFITAFIGLWHWRRDKGSVSEEDAIVLNRLTWRTAVVSAVVTVVGTLALMWGMQWLHQMELLNENPMSMLDSAVAVLSAVATWWLVKSYIQHWWLWIVADALSLALCLSLEMWWMAALYGAYTASAIIGFMHWKRKGIYLKI